MRFDFDLNQFIDRETGRDVCAVSGSDHTLTWAELESRTMHLAAVLKSLNIPAGEPVILYGHKEAGFATAILACFLSATTYTPIDRIYPGERVRRILTITGAQVVIHCGHEPVPECLNGPRVIDASGNLLDAGNSNRIPMVRNKLHEALQYIMFTSGSTGEPKGVQIYRSSVNHFVHWVLRDFRYKGAEVFMNQAPFTFDVSLCDLVSAFASGGTLVLNDAELTRNTPAFLERVRSTGCTVWTSTPSFIFIFLRDPGFRAAEIPSLHTFLFMGEELPARTCSILFERFPGCRILNAYGPTEATIVTTLAEITEEHSRNSKPVPIGKAMPGSTLLIDKGENDGNEGELIICGPHVSPGYLNRPDLNDIKFFEHNGQRAFRTGDLAYADDGVFYFLGRNDDQVKLHGFRIELDEISAVLCRQEGIQDAVTIPLKRCNEVKKIISFVLAAGHDIGTDLRGELFERIGQSLPYYMIPSEILVIDQFPVSVSHKIDRKRLVEYYLSMS